MNKLKPAITELSSAIWNIKVLLVGPKSWLQMLITSKKVLARRNEVADGYYSEALRLALEINTEEDFQVTGVKITALLQHHVKGDTKLLSTDGDDPIMSEARVLFVRAMNQFVDECSVYLKEYKDSLQ